MLELRTLEKKTVKELAELFNFGFQEYLIPMSVTPEKVEKMLRSQHMRMDLSVEGVKDGETVGFCWLGIRGEQAWVGGIGVGPAFRDQGYGRVLLSHCIEKARELGYSTFRLECIEKNQRALHLYESLGLKTIHGLYNFKNENPTPVEVDQAGYRLIPGNEVELYQLWDAFHPRPKSWQGDLPTLLDGIEEKELWFLTREDGTVVGAMIYIEEETKIVIQDLGALEDNKKLYQIMLAELHKKQKEISYFFIPGNFAVIDVLADAGYVRFIDQVEMSMSLK